MPKGHFRPLEAGKRKNKGFLDTLEQGFSRFVVSCWKCWKNAGKTQEKRRKNDKKRGPNRKDYHLLMEESFTPYVLMLSRIFWIAHVTVNQYKGKSIMDGIRG